MSRKLATVVAFLGVLVLVAAGATYLLVDKYGARLPDDTDETRIYEGTAATLLNAEALGAGDLEQAILSDVPITVERHTEVTETDGDTALIRDERVTTSGGQPVASTTPTFAVDRKSLEATDDHPSDWDVVDATGLVISWPFDTEKKDYTGWVGDAQETTTLRYVREEERGGVDTYVFESDIEPMEITDPEILAAFPQEASLELLTGLSQAPSVSEELRAGLQALLPNLTGPVPLTYTYEGKTTYWVEPTTGVVVDLDRSETRMSHLAIPGQAEPTPFIPVSDWSYSSTDDTVADAAGDASDGKDALDLWGRTVPLIVGIVGLVLLLVGLVFMIRPRRRQTT